MYLIVPRYETFGLLNVLNKGDQLHSLSLLTVHISRWCWCKPSNIWYSSLADAFFDESASTFVEILETFITYPAVYAFHEHLVKYQVEIKGFLSENLLQKKKLLLVRINAKVIEQSHSSVCFVHAR